MNKIFSKVWNARLGCVQVASELAGSPVSQSSSGASPAHRRGILVSGVLVALMSMFGASQAMAGDAVCADPVTGQASGTVTNSLGTSVACGNNAKADGVNAVVIGNNATGAGGANQIVIGNGAYATGSTPLNTGENVSIGNDVATSITGNNNISLGTNAGDRISGNDNITVGTNANTDATANQAIAIGENTKAVSRSTAME